MKKKLHIKKGDKVRVISGEHRGKEGQVIDVDLKKLRARVEGVNLVKKHSKPTSQNPQGGIIEKEAGIHISNLMLLADGVPTRVGHKTEEGKKVRFAKRSGEAIK